jgi:hypothetical protein
MTQVGKGLFPGTIKALYVYANLPGKTSDLLLEPSRPGTKASVQTALRSASNIYFKDVPPMTVNIIRKYFHSEYLRIVRTEQDVLEILKNADKHSKEVAFNVYCVQNPECDGKYGRRLYTGLFKDPVEWPSDAVCPHDAVEELESRHAQLALPDAGAEAVGSSSLQLVAYTHEWADWEEEDEDDLVQPSEVHTTQEIVGGHIVGSHAVTFNYYKHAVPFGN